MNSMTNEEKIRAYDEAIERAKKFHTPDSNNSNLKAVLELIFPKLAESEDEKIRKGLIEALKTSKTVGELKFILPEPTREECIAYLEKQKEYFQSGKGLYYYDGEKTTYCGYPSTEENPYDFAMSQQEEQKEQKQWSEEDGAKLGALINYFEGDALDYSTDDIVNWLKSLRPQP